MFPSFVVTDSSNSPCRLYSFMILSAPLVQISLSFFHLTVYRGSKSIWRFRRTLGPSNKAFSVGEDLASGKSFEEIVPLLLRQIWIENRTADGVLLCWISHREIGQVTMIREGNFRNSVAFNLYFETTDTSFESRNSTFYPAITVILTTGLKSYLHSRKRTVFDWLTIY